MVTWLTKLTRGAGPRRAEIPEIHQWRNAARLDSSITLALQVPPFRRCLGMFGEGAMFGSSHLLVARAGERKLATAGRGLLCRVAS